jgi:hypothetical protein
MFFAYQQVRFVFFFLKYIKGIFNSILFHFVFFFSIIGHLPYSYGLCRKLYISSAKRCWGYHWTTETDQCTLHKVVFYAMINGEKKHFSLCFILEDLNHNVPFVHAVQKYVTNFIKKNCTEVTKVEYFTDQKL